MAEATNKILNRPTAVASDSVHEAARTEPDDRDLVERCQRGDLDAYEILVHRHRQRLYGLVYGMVRHEQDATDLCQETFVKAWQAIRGFKKDAGFYTWLYRIATNLCVDRARQRARRQMVTFEEAVDPDTNPDVDLPPSKQASAPDALGQKELGQQIAAAVLELSPEHRAVIQLREYEGLEYAEIAAAVGCSIGTVMSRLHYARKHLQKLLKDVI
jgi:RNA polymerase sigma-70 factor (ECF subfamily)